MSRSRIQRGLEKCLSSRSHSFNNVVNNYWDIFMRSIHLKSFRIMPLTSQRLPPLCWNCWFMEVSCFPSCNNYIVSISMQEKWTFCTCQYMNSFSVCQIMSHCFWKNVLPVLWNHTTIFDGQICSILLKLSLLLLHSPFSSSSSSDKTQVLNILNQCCLILITGKTVFSFGTKSIWKAPQL